MKKWLRRKVRRWLERGDEYPAIVAATPDPRVEIEGLTFNVMSANGGTIIQTRQYNSKIDRNVYSTHIIPDGEDVAERIGQIVSLELLKNS